MVAPDKVLKPFQTQRLLKLKIVENTSTFFRQLSSTKHTIFDSLQVQVGRLGRSKSLWMSAYDATSTSCVVQADRPRDAIRW